MLYRKNVVSTTPKFTTDRALPMSRLVLRFTIMARMSVPPVEPPTSKASADATAGSSTAKHRSSHMSPVTVWFGSASSNSEVYIESATDA